MGILTFLNLLWKVFLVFATSANCLEAYDFIVVGSGAGGGTVTRRLVENGKYSVLLIETGGRPKEGHDIPARSPGFVQDKDVTFKLESTPQKNVALRKGGVATITAGKMLGGTTSLNHMYFSRGSPQDWDNWANVTGDDGWKYSNMIKYFKKSEDYQGDFPSSELHGKNGPITVSRPKYAPGLEHWLRAGRELGYPEEDPNGLHNIGFSPIEFSKRKGRRVSSLIGYLNPVMHMPNLKVLINTNVTQVIFQGKRAIGVRYVSNNNGVTKQSTAYATKEIIISAGTYFSPIILQRSGIGPRELLNRANISVVTELPTGENFHGHNAINLNFAINNASVVIDEARDLTPNNFEFFNKFGVGPFSNTRGATGQAFIASSVASAERDAEWPDLQLVMSHSKIPFSTHDPIHLEVAEDIVKAGETPISVAVFLGRPKSRGSVRINVDNVLDNPKIDMGFLDDDKDVQILLEGIWEALHVIEQTHAYSVLRPRYIPIKQLHACNSFPVRSTEYWTCYMKQLNPSGCHPVGTNKMGKRNDPTAVVDSELRVIGIDNLRVVDASIMPFTTNANPQAAVYGIAERAAELILKRWDSSIPQRLNGKSRNAFRVVVSNVYENRPSQNPYQ